MHIPKGKPVHENLKTSYLNATALLADLQIDSFTGYLQAVFPYSKGNIFLADGRILNAIDESADKARSGEEAIDAILLRSTSPDGKISVYSHTKKIVEAIAGRIEGEVVYQALDSDFTDLKKLVEKLKQQNSSRFYIEVEFDQFGDGVIYIIDGEIDGVLSLAAGDVIEGLLAYERVLSLLTEKTATFHVYRCKIIVNQEISDNVLSFPEVIPTPVTKLSQKLHEDEPQALDPQGQVSLEETLDQKVEETLDQNTEEEHLDQVLEVQDNQTKVEETISEFKEVAPQIDDKIDRVDDLTPIDDDREDKILLGIMEEIIQIVEKVSILVSKDTNFAVAFRGGLLKVTPEYPVFDPFVEDFSYQDGKIALATPLPKEVLINGLMKALKYTLDELVRTSSNSQLRETIVGALLRLEELKQQEFESFSISSALAELIRID
jgi:hypothetical protein